jgi:integrase
MTRRRSRGDGGLYWHEGRQRWIATVYTGFTATGKRKKREASAKTKTAAKAKLRAMLRDHDDGVPIAPHGYMVGDAVRDWLQFGLRGRDRNTVENRTILAHTHVIPALGRRKLRDLTADDVDIWLESKANDLSTDTLGRILSILRRSITRAQARDRVKRNVALLCDIPKGRAGRPSKALTLDQAEAVLAAVEGTSIEAYVVVSLLVGARTEELRALTWSHVDLEGDPDADPPVPPSVQVWQSVRSNGDTKTRKSRRTLQLPVRCVEVLVRHRARQARARAKAGDRWEDHDLVFSTRVGTELDAGNIRRAFRNVVRKAGLDPQSWTPRELRHSFVSLLSEAGVPLEDISRLVGHGSTVITETVYRKELRPVLTRGAEAMDVVFMPRAEDVPIDRQLDRHDTNSVELKSEAEPGEDS